jgi:hypothetical protein
VSVTGCLLLALCPVLAQTVEVDAGVGAGVESFEAPSATTESRAALSLTLLKGAADLELGVDAIFESAPKIDFAEHVFTGRAHFSLGADVKISPSARAVVEGRAVLKGGAPRDFDRAKATFDALPGDIFIDGYFSSADVRFGFQRIPEHSALTVFALKAQGEWRKLSWLVAYVPFFEPHRFALWGQDEALLQPALGLAIPTRGLDSTVEDTLTPRLLETKRPAAFAGDLALWLRSTGTVKFGVSWVWVNEKTPAVEVDPELSALISAQQAGRPVDAALALSVQSRLAANEQLYSATYRRQHIFGGDASFLAGPLQFDVDVGYSPRQTFIDAQLRPLSKPVVTWVASLARAEDGALSYAAGYQGMAVFDVRAKEQLFLIEPGYAVGAERTGWFHLFWGQVGYRREGSRWELSARVLFEPIGRSLALAPQVTFHQGDRWKFWLAGDVFLGSDFSPLGYFRRNTQIAAGARWDFL